MATQDGLIKLKGSIGELTFYKTADGYRARRKAGINGDRIRTDPAFIRTRENFAEFGRAGKAAKLFRTALRSSLTHVKDRRLSNRLFQAFFRVIKADTVNGRGLRKVLPNQTKLLQGFEFNENGKLPQTLLVRFTPAINRGTGVQTINVDAFVPTRLIKSPEGATHCKLVSAGLEVDFENETFTVATSESAAIALTNTEQAALALSQQMPAASTHALFLLLGISFYQQLGAELYELNNGAFNALAIVQVDDVPA